MSEQSNKAEKGIRRKEKALCAAIAQEFYDEVCIEARDRKPDVFGLATALKTVAKRWGADVD